MYNTSLIGSRWILNREMLGVPAGSVGYCFNEYDDFDYPDKSGIQIIFSNGNFDGFSVDEQEAYLEYVGFVPQYQSYSFRNVMDVTRDFHNGYWSWK